MFIFDALVMLFYFTGWVPAALLSMVMPMGDGTGNESGLAEHGLWALGIGIIIWIGLIGATVWGTIWLISHVSVAIH